MHIYMPVHVHVHVYVHVHVCMNACVRMSMYMHVYIYKYTYKVQVHVHVRRQYADTSAGMHTFACAQNFKYVFKSITMTPTLRLARVLTLASMLVFILGQVLILKPMGHLFFN